MVTQIVIAICISVVLQTRFVGDDLITSKLTQSWAPVLSVRYTNTSWHMCPLRMKQKIISSDWWEYQERKELKTAQQIQELVEHQNHSRTCEWWNNDQVFAARRENVNWFMNTSDVPQFHKENQNWQKEANADSLCALERDWWQIHERPRLRERPKKPKKPKNHNWWSLSKKMICLTKKTTSMWGTRTAQVKKDKWLDRLHLKSQSWHHEYGHSLWHLCQRQVLKLSQRNNEHFREIDKCNFINTHLWKEPFHRGKATQPKSAFIFATLELSVGAYPLPAVLSPVFWSHPWDLLVIARAATTKDESTSSFSHPRSPWPSNALRSPCSNVCPRETKKPVLKLVNISRGNSLHSGKDRVTHDLLFWFKTQCLFEVVFLISVAPISTRPTEHAASSNQSRKIFNNSQPGCQNRHVHFIPYLWLFYHLFCFFLFLWEVAASRRFCFCVHTFGNTWPILLWLVSTACILPKKILAPHQLKYEKQAWGNTDQSVVRACVWENIKLISMDFQKHSFDKGTFLLCFKGANIVDCDRIRSLRGKERKKRHFVWLFSFLFCFQAKGKSNTIQIIVFVCLLLWGRFSQQKNWLVFALSHDSKSKTQKKETKCLVFCDKMWDISVSKQKLFFCPLINKCKKHQQTNKKNENTHLFSPFLFFQTQTQELFCTWCSWKISDSKTAFSNHVFIFSLKYFILSRTPSQSVFFGGNWSEKDKKRQKHLLLLQTAHKRWTCRLKITQTIFKKSVKKFQQQYSPQLLTTKLAIQLSLLQLIQHFREIKLLKLINHKPNARCFDKQWISNVMNDNEIAKITKECK